MPTEKIITSHLITHRMTRAKSKNLLKNWWIPQWTTPIFSMQFKNYAHKTYVPHFKSCDHCDFFCRQWVQSTCCHASYSPEQGQRSLRNTMVFVSEAAHPLESTLSNLYQAACPSHVAWAALVLIVAEHKSCAVAQTTPTWTISREIMRLWWETVYKFVNVLTDYQYHQSVRSSLC